MSNQALISALARLLTSPGRLPSTAFSSEERSAIAEFSRHKGGLRLVMIARNASYAITNRSALEAHLADLDPAALASCRAAGASPEAGASPDSPAETAGVLLKGPFYLLLKSISPSASWQDATRTLNVAQIEQNAGVAALALKTHDSWHTAEPLWLVASQARFEHTEWLPATARGTLAYYPPQYSALVRQWLAFTARAPLLEHYTDPPT
ncbi:hypothetical protein OPU71_09605 [Niveibacterium sp. 24ML]|uniref:hypothetical protein n=1 Tax=Niveibacterium sp. 24ML TaxID=2985512 RepID=UPI0022711294|nr:hypothetical protein [Niveibacterium sp. 24ML]MCX9156376.1 hypothetical protein [Niveibacterium sp. 24ML]